MNKLGVEIRRILKENLKNFLTNVEDQVYISFTEDDELYVTDKKGEQHKISSTVFYETENDIDYSQLKDDKLYVIKDPFGIYYKNLTYDTQDIDAKPIINIMDSVNESVKNNSESIENLKKEIEKLQNYNAEKENLNKIKNIKVNMPISKITLGSKPALNLSSLIFTPNQSLLFKSIKITGRNFVPTSSVDISIIFQIDSLNDPKSFTATLTEADSTIKLPVGLDKITDGFVNVEIVSTKDVEAASLDFIYEIDRINEEIITGVSDN